MYYGKYEVNAVNNGKLLLILNVEARPWYAEDNSNNAENPKDAQSFLKRRTARQAGACGAGHGIFSSGVAAAVRRVHRLQRDCARGVREHGVHARVSRRRVEGEPAARPSDAMRFRAGRLLIQPLRDAARRPSDQRHVPLNRTFCI